MNGDDGYSLSNSCKLLVCTLKEGTASLNGTLLLQNLVYCFERAKLFCVNPTALLKLTDSHSIHIFVLQFFLFIPWMWLWIQERICISYKISTLAKFLFTVDTVYVRFRCFAFYLFSQLLELVKLFSGHGDQMDCWV